MKGTLHLGTVHVGRLGFHIRSVFPVGTLGVDVLGATQFNPDGSRLVRIDGILYRQRNFPAVRGRFRFTCAHEVFHAMFHGQLFRRGGRSVCLERHIREDFIEPSQASEDFTEWQANRGAAALLMPHTIFAEHVKQENRKIGDTGADLFVRNLAAKFEVSLQSVRLRLQTLKLLTVLDGAVELQYDGIDSYEDPRHR